MFTKVTTLLLIASVAFAAHISFSGNVGAKIDDDLVKLEKVINATIKQAGQQLIEVLTVFNHTASKTENRTAFLLNNYREASQVILDNLKDKAKAANVNIDECLGKDETDFLNVAKPFELANIRCVRGVERGVVDEANVTYYRNLQFTLRLVFEIRNDIEKCDKKEECLQKLEPTVERETREIPQRVEREVKQVSTNIETVQTPKLERCQSEILIGVRNKGGPLLDKMVKCINRKLKN